MRAIVLAQGRVAAEAGMIDTCTIRRNNGEVTDDFSGVITVDWDDLYEGKCRVQQAQTQAQETDNGENRLLLLRLEVQLPMSVVGLQVNDEITITASVHDPDLVGRKFLVHDLAHKTEATARRVQCTERTD